MKTNYYLILACIAASLWAWQQNPTFAEQNLVFSFNNLVHGRVWTLVTALFVHGNVLHLFGNMLFLFVFGNTLEKTVGARNHLTIFFTGGFAGFILGLPFTPRAAYNIVVVSHPSLIRGHDPHVAYVAHIIGFLTGLPFGIALSEHWKRNLLLTLLIFGVYLAILQSLAHSPMGK